MSPVTRARRLLSSARTRIVAWFLLLLVLAGLVSLFATRQVLLVRLDESVDFELRQEIDEMRRLATGIDPEDSQPFGTRIDRLFDVFLSRNIPPDAETFVTYIPGGTPEYDERLGIPFAALESNPEVRARLAAITQYERGTLDLADVGRVEYAAVPLTDGTGQDVLGVFGVFEFYEPQADDVDEVVRVLAGVGAVVVLLSSTILWSTAGRILEPVRTLTDTATAISSSDLTARIDVHGDDELSRLALTFNAMLDRLATAFDAQRDFVNDAGHELRTPITIIRGHLELMGDQPEDREETVAIVMDELARMTRIVEDLLILAKAQRPDFLHLTTVDLAELTNKLASKVSAMASREWLLEATGRGLLVADRQRLSQAVIQLVANATQHTADGDTVAIGSAVVDGEARLWVRDTGEGVPQAEQERIFDRFHRALGGRRRSGGAGLGLSIVRAIAEAHGGRVELRSRPGAGATFTLVLPLDQPPGHPEVTPEAEA